MGKKKPGNQRKKVTGKLVVLQKVGEMPDGKIHFIAGQDETVFHLEENDEFFTAVFKVDPFKKG